MRFNKIDMSNPVSQSLLMEGKHPFVIRECEMVKSKYINKETGKNDDQIHLIFEVLDNKGNKNTIHDWVSSDNVKKIYYICKCLDMMNVYENEVLIPNQLIGTAGQFMLKKKEDSTYLRVHLYLPPSKNKDTFSEDDLEDKEPLPF